MVAPHHDLECIEIPGLAEARRYEAELRDRAFTPLTPQIAGIPVRPFCLRHLLALDFLKNGFIVECQFERPGEKVAHAVQFLGIVSTLCDLDAGPFFELRFYFQRYRARRFIRRVLKNDSDQVFTDIARYLSEALYDAPKGGSASQKQWRALATASFMATLMDNMVAAGYAWSEEAIFNLPLVRLWQYWRCALKRLNPELTIPNPSDRLADEFIAKLNADRASAAASAKDSHA